MRQSGTYLTSPDSSSQNLVTSSNGSPENATGISGYAMGFDGDSAYLSVNSFNSVTGSNARSIETWIKSDHNESVILGWGTTGNRWNFGWNSQGPLVLTQNNDGSRQGTGVIGNGEWNHFAHSYPGNGSDLNSSRLYLNGRLIDAPSSSIDGAGEHRK